MSLNESMSKDKPAPGGRSKKNTAVSMVRSSAAEYLTFVAANGNSEASVEMRYEDENGWLTQKMMVTLYDVSASAVNQHLKRILSDNELEESSVVKQYLTAPADGKDYTIQALQTTSAITAKWPSKLPSILPFWQDTDGWGQILERMRSGHFPGHFVRLARSMKRAGRLPTRAAVDSSRHFSRQSVASANKWLCGIPTIVPTKCRDSATAREPRHFG